MTISARDLGSAKLLALHNVFVVMFSQVMESNSEAPKARPVTYMN